MKEDLINPEEPGSTSSNDLINQFTSNPQPEEPGSTSSNDLLINNVKEDFIKYYESGNIPRAFWNEFIKANNLNPCLCRLGSVVKWIETNWGYKTSKELIHSRLKNGTGTKSK